ncbi:MAG TPA: histidine kinase dimerization/phospho-acceptor domain-containing protein [Bryobacteraceae bacterium]|nr:histidine kinase dimerization/phospho-acceptor domain-containing protein [Bryobacteraceae bacterium]
MKPGKRRSIAWLVFVWYAGSAFLLLAGGTGFLYFVLARSFDRENTEYLTEKTRILETLLREHPGQQATVQWEVERESLAHPSIRVLSRVSGSNGKVLVETSGMASDLPPAAFPEAVDVNTEAIETRDIRASNGRMYRLAATRTGSGGESRPYTLQVAVDLTFEKDLLSGYRRQLWIVLGLGLVASILIGRRIAVQGLRPLGEISETVRRTRSTNLREHVPLDRMPSEVQELASTFNDMLDRLGDSFERLSRFSSDIAHELRTPLNNLRGEIDLALSKRRSAEEYVDLLGSLSKECEQLTRLIDSLLFLARAEQPAMQISREKLDIGHELQLVCDFYEAAAGEAGVHLTVTAPQDLRFQVDRTLFQRAVANVVQNALSHTPSGGEVHLEARNGTGELLVKVSDCFYSLDRGAAIRVPAAAPCFHNWPRLLAISPAVAAFLRRLAVAARTGTFLAYFRHS